MHAISVYNFRYSNLCNFLFSLNWKIMEENMNTKQILAENTKRLRNLSKLSQFDFADEINMSKTVLSDIENARANPTLETLERLA
ncbi:MAG: helix-turn-helix transcriptional regulator, partial [Clostridiales bacterium]|nr:helix-turn-helix transcriptional regulator [Clostridiales bacterium]